MASLQSAEVRAPVDAEYQHVLSSEALDFVADLHRHFDGRRQELLRARQTRQGRLDAGEMPGFLAETRSVREGPWQLAAPPADLIERKVEITGPVDRKMVINALNSGASVFMADFEDALSPTWPNIVQGQANLREAVRRTLEFRGEDGRAYRLNDRIATLVVRPRGWHLVEKHVLVDKAPISGSLFDFGLYLFHNAAELAARGSGPYYYLPKMESHLEARLWSEVFKHAEQRLKLKPGTIRATVLIETILAAFEMEEILYELREHIVGLNAGRWDYIFSIIKKFRNRLGLVMPDRAQITMTVPFMRAYTELLVRTCHKRGAHAIGGMAQYIPNRRKPEANQAALQKVRDDKVRESTDGFDGTWVAHPDLVPVAREVFDRHLGDQAHQKQRLREDVNVTASQLADFRIPGGEITESGLRNNITVPIQYLANWLNGRGAVAIFDLMEDAATAEISRSQVWQWIKSASKLASGKLIDQALFDAMLNEELGKLDPQFATEYRQGAALFKRLVKDDFADFLTLVAYPELE
ncbi:MAG TPA: malate synthase A [Candidatus Binataceae bacterium]|nr:malate synthase A [Candidatus Binataceae bacterium]